MPRAVLLTGKSHPRQIPTGPSVQSKNGEVSKLFAPPQLRERPRSAQLARSFKWPSVTAPNRGTLRNGVPSKSNHRPCSQYEPSRSQVHCKTTTKPVEPPAGSTVRLLAARASTRSTKLLRLAPARVCHEQAAVICRQNLLDLSLRRLVDNCRPGGSERGEAAGREESGAPVPSWEESGQQRAAAHISGCRPRWPWQSPGGWLRRRTGGDHSARGCVRQEKRARTPHRSAPAPPPI